jgi:hypothetical protein
MKSCQIINGDIYCSTCYLFYGGETGFHIFQISYSDILVSTWMERGRENLKRIFVLQAEIHKKQLFWRGGGGEYLQVSNSKLR